MEVDLEGTLGGSVIIAGLRCALIKHSQPPRKHQPSDELEDRLNKW